MKTIGIRLACLSAGLVCLAAPSSFGDGLPEPGLVWYGTVRNNIVSPPVRLTTGNLTWVLASASGNITIQARLTNILDQFSYLLIVPAESVLPGLTPGTNAIQLTSPPTTYTRSTVFLNGQPIFLAGSTPATFALSPTDRGRIERVDLAFQQNDLDSDGDGMPDWWENLNFPGGALPDADADADGLTNLREYRAGTDPRDSGSCFEFIEIQQSAGAALVKWASMPGKTYTLLRSPSLLLPAASYTLVRSGILATPPVNAFSDTDAGAPNSCFYLLRVE